MIVSRSDFIAWCNIINKEFAITVINNNNNKTTTHLTLPIGQAFGTLKKRINGAEGSCQRP
jgi:hypothetical protein